MGVSFSDAAPAHRSLKDQHREGRRTTLPYYEVNVPTMNSSGRRGLRVFTGEADKPGAAIQIAHKIYAAAVAAQQSGLHIPERTPHRWQKAGRLGRARCAPRLGNCLVGRDDWPLERPVQLDSRHQPAALGPSRSHDLDRRTVRLAEGRSPSSVWLR